MNMRIVSLIIAFAHCAFLNSSQNQQRFFQVQNKFKDPIIINIYGHQERLVFNQISQQYPIIRDVDAALKAENSLIWHKEGIRDAIETIRLANRNGIITVLDTGSIRDFKYGIIYLPDAPPARPNQPVPARPGSKPYQILLQNNSNAQFDLQTRKANGDITPSGLFNNNDVVTIYSNGKNTDLRSIQVSNQNGTINLLKAVNDAIDYCENMDNITKAVIRIDRNGRVATQYVPGSSY